MNMTENDKKWVKCQMLNLTGFVILLFAASLAASGRAPSWGVISILAIGAFAVFASAYKEYQLEKEEKKVPNK
jgi:hypothetical protein